jgi:hypothetical protein
VVRFLSQTNGVDEVHPDPDVVRSGLPATPSRHFGILTPSVRFGPEANNPMAVRRFA